MLLGGYSSGSDEEGGGAANKSSPPQKPSRKGLDAPKPAAEAKAKAAAKATSAPAKAKAAEPEAHGPFCYCNDCETLMARFIAKNVQTKGIRFRCKLDGHMAATKAAAADHIRATPALAKALQDFKREKNPQLFAAAKKAAEKASSKISFAVDDVLRKRPRDDAASFGGFAKKEKPELPPCMQPEHIAMQEPIIQQAAPWVMKERPSNEDATAMDMETDRLIAEAQIARFCVRNTMVVKAGNVKCKLCYATFDNELLCQRHIRATHQDEFEKEIGIWERFLHMNCKRQPPFGWVCKVCNSFFPTDGAVWRHLGKEVFIRREERHTNEWREKEDRWGHEEDAECCGDGMNSGGLSFDSVRMFNQQARQQEMEGEARQMNGGKKEEESEDDEPDESNIGVKQSISEF